MSEYTPPKACRPLRATFVAVSAIVMREDYLEMSESEFVDSVMESTGGAAIPNAVREIFLALVDEAGKDTP